MLTNTTTDKPANYIPGLEALRGVAILAVLAYHYFGFPAGWMGVDLFLVLSGYLITKSLLQLKDRSDRYKVFYKNRVLRIFPLYYGSLVAIYASFLLFSDDTNRVRFQGYFDNWQYFALFAQNWLFITKGLLVEPHLNHYWSLAVEEQFYLVWPTLIFFLSGKKRILFYCLLIFVGIFILRIAYIYTYPQTQGYTVVFNSLFRMDAFVSGAAVNFIVVKNLRRAVAIFLLFLAALMLGGLFVGSFSQDTRFFHTIGYSFLAILTASLIYLLKNVPQDFFQKGRLMKALLFIGRISYGLYIFHWPVLHFLGYHIGHYLHAETGNRDLAIVLSRIICTAISIAISSLSFFYFERYFLRKKTVINNIKQPAHIA